MGKELTPKQRAFVAEYLVDLNATQAAIRAGYSAKSADKIGTQLLGKTSVAAAVAEARDARAERVQLAADEVLRELAILVRSDVRYFQVDDNGNLTLTENAPDEAWRAVASVKHKITTHGKGDDAYTTRDIEYRLWDKNSAIEKAMKHLGLLVDKHEVKGSVAHVHGVVLLPAVGE